MSEEREKSGLSLTEARLMERDRDSAPTAASVNLVPFRPHSMPAGFLWKRGEHFKVGEVQLCPRLVDHVCDGSTPPPLPSYLLACNA